MLSEFEGILGLVYDDLANGRHTDFHKQYSRILTDQKCLKELTGSKDLRGFLPGVAAPTGVKTGKKEPATAISAAFHYTSGCLGRWFRVLLASEPPTADATDLSPLELHQHEKMYDEISRDHNIPVWPSLVRPLIVQFGGKNQLVKASDAHSVIFVDTDKAKGLKEYFDKHEAKGFYRLVLGLSEWDDGSEPFRLLNKMVVALSYQIAALHTLSGCTCDGSSHDERRHLLLAFCFSFFLSIRSKSRKAATPTFILVAPLHEGGVLPCYIAQKHFDVSGAFVGSYDKPPLGPTLQNVTGISMRIVRALSAMESRVMREERHRDGLSIHDEDVLRKCAIVEERTQITGNKYHSEIARLLGLKTVESLKQEGVDEARKRPELDELLKMTGADHEMVRILNKLKLYAKAGFDNSKSTVKDKLRPGQTLFLHSEPGCGKEMLASLYNMFGPRYLQSDDKDMKAYTEIVSCLLYEQLRDLEKPRRGGPVVADIVEMYLQNNIDAWTKAKEAGIEKGVTVFVSQMRAAKRVNFEAVNAGDITGESFDEILIGGRRKPGVFVRQHFLCGTVFLDEINTIDLKVANKLLRILAEPYQVTLKNAQGDYEALKVNLQIVFGSNKSPEQLISDGMNSAVVFRIAENAIRIPPLRERKSDIALFVNKYLLSRKKGSLWLGRVRRMSLDGLRLICELPWPDNYRGVRGLLNDILEDREMRQIEDPEITFDDVIRAVSRRETMGRASIPQKTRRLVLSQE